MEGGSIRVSDIGEHLDDSSVFRPPWQRHKSIRLRMQQKIAVCLISKPGDGRSVKSNAVFERARQLFRHDGNILLLPKDIAESKTNKLYIFFLCILDNLFLCVLHKNLLAALVCHVHLSVRIFTVRGHHRKRGGQHFFYINIKQAAIFR